MTPEEILRRAHANELRAVAFYDEVLARADNRRLRGTLMVLLRNEREHVKTLEGEMGFQPAETDQDEDRVDVPAGDGPLDVETVLTLARRREEASIRTYRRLLDAESDPECVALLSELLEEELGHREFVLRLEREFL